MIFVSYFTYFYSILNNSHKRKWVDTDSFLPPLLLRIQFESCQFLNFLSSSKNQKSSRKHLTVLVPKCFALESWCVSFRHKCPVSTNFWTEDRNSLVISLNKMYACMSVPYVGFKQNSIDIRYPKQCDS